LLMAKPDLISRLEEEERLFFLGCNEEERLAGRSGRTPQMPPPPSPLCAEGKRAAMQPAQ
ncbi:UNVERIFIED_CONTAM: hypothetical protein K2H54_065966, partial [Gekko kuhli]